MRFDAKGRENGLLSMKDIVDLHASHLAAYIAHAGRARVISGGLSESAQSRRLEQLLYFSRAATSANVHGSLTRYTTELPTEIYQPETSELVNGYIS